MTKRFLVVATCLMALAGSVAVAHAATKHNVNDAATIRSLSATPKLIVYTGIVKDKVGGEGALIVRGTPSGTPGVISQVSTAFFKRGSITLKGVTTATSNADGSTTYTGSHKAVAGTGLFKGISGKLKISGTAPADDPTRVNLRAAGVLVY